MTKKALQRLLAGLLVVLAVLCSLPTESMAALVKVQVKAEYANVYQSASTSSLVLRKPPRGSVMTCGATKGDWCYVKYDGVVGYVLKSKLTTSVSSVPEPGDTSTDTQPTPAPTQAPSEAPAPSATPAPTKAPENGSSSSASSIKVVTIANSKLYKRADAASGHYGTIPKGKTIVCTKVSGIWARVEAAGLTGYVLKSNLKSAGSSSSGSGSSSTATPAPDVSGAKMICYISKDVSLYSAASSSSSKLASLKTGTKVMVMQVKGGWGQVYTTSGTLGYVPSSYLSKTKVTAAGTVKLMDWFTSDIQSIFSVGTTATVVDVNTGKSFKIRRKGGILHADVETYSTADTKTMLAVYGGKWSWDRRAIWVVVDGVYYAASMNGMAHGEETSLSNNMEGHFCIHFLNSRTHGTNKVCPLHQACIKAAYNAKP